MIHLLNGSTAVRVKSSEGCDVLPCGCAHSATHWQQLCHEHWADCFGLHEAAQTAHLATLEYSEGPY